MKVTALFLLVLSIDFGESQKICVERGDTLKLLNGRDGIPGVSGPKGDRGSKGSHGLPGIKGEAGPPGENGMPGTPGQKGEHGYPGQDGYPGIPAVDGMKGEYGQKGENGYPGPPGLKGARGLPGADGGKGVKGEPGHPGAKMEKSLVVQILNDYYVSQSGYYNSLYHVTSSALTDGRIDSGGWGSELTGNPKLGSSNAYIQATYCHPVYVTSVTVAGGFIPSWNDNIKSEHAKIRLEYSLNGKSWFKVFTIQSPSAKKMISHDLPKPITAQYWRLTSTEVGKLAGTTEFALKPLIKP